MKRDSGLVDTIRGYLENGGQTPESVQNNLQLSEDFVFDGHEAVTDTQSESAKVLNQMVEGTVQKRVNNMLEKEKQQTAQANHKAQQVSAATQTRLLLKHKKCLLLKRNTCVPLKHLNVFC